jgi:uncharacterized membrane protein YbhN (UPF0104 family)
MAIGALTLYFIVDRYRTASAAMVLVPQLHAPAVLGVSCVALLLAQASYALLWREIVSRLDRRRMNVVDALAVFFTSWLGRYVPTSVPYVAGKIVLSARLGYARNTVLSSIAYENVVLVIVGASSSCLLLPVMLAGTRDLAIHVLVAVVAAAMIVAVGSPILPRLVGLVSRFAHRDADFRVPVLQARDAHVALIVASVALVLNGLSFSLLLRSLTGLSPAEMVAAGAAYNLAGVAGIAAIPVPSGFGVREAVLAALLKLIVPLDIALAAALLSRLVAFAADLALGLAGVSALTVRGRSRAHASLGADGSNSGPGAYTQLENAAESG